MVSAKDIRTEEEYLARVFDQIKSQICSRSDTALQGETVIGKDYNALVNAAWATQNNAKALTTLEQAEESPYFGRIDFQEDDLDFKDILYIGRSSIYDGKMDLLVYDWRAPICSLYYSHGAGKASFRAPGGHIHGTLSLKRQYTISGRQLQKVHEVFGTANREAQDAEIQGEQVDEMLQEVLQRNSTGQMRQIVQSIQAEQDAIIRSTAGVIVVQGPAGSGKTVVALHRAAYLLYHMREQKRRGSAGESGFLSDDISSAQKMLVVSPNDIFSQYIGNVLPDLNEDQIQQVILDRHLLKTLNGRLSPSRQLQFEIESKEAYYEKTLAGTIGEVDAKMAATRLKTSETMLDILRSYVKSLEPSIEVLFEDIAAGHRDGRTVLLGAGDLVETFRRKSGRHGVSLMQRLQDVAEAVEAEIQERKRILKDQAKAERDRLGRTRSVAGWFDPEKLRQEIAALTQGHSRILEELKGLRARPLSDLYSQMWRHAVETAPDHDLGSIAAIGVRTAAALQTRNIPYEDVVPIALLDGYYRGFPTLRTVEHVIVDEAQDYSILHYEYLFNCLREDCGMTIVGDINQAANSSLNLRSYDDLRHVFSGNVSRLDLTRSYRSSQEITGLAEFVLGDGTHIDNVRRTGDIPMLIKAPTSNRLPEIVADTARRAQRNGRRSVAILCKTQRDCEHLHQRMPNDLAVKTLTASANALTDGIFLLPVYLAKGLEFDAVIVYDVGQIDYGLDADRRTLYTACTRALHELYLCCAGQISPLLPVGQGDMLKTVTSDDTKNEMNPRGLSNPSATEPLLHKEVSFPTAEDGWKSSASAPRIPTGLGVSGDSGASRSPGAPAAKANESEIGSLSGSMPTKPGRPETRVATVPAKPTLELMNSAMGAALVQRISEDYKDYVCSQWEQRKASCMKPAPSAEELESMRADWIREAGDRYGLIRTHCKLLDGYLNGQAEKILERKAEDEKKAEEKRLAWIVAEEERKKWEEAEKQRAEEDARQKLKRRNAETLTQIKADYTAFLMEQIGDVNKIEESRLRAAFLSGAQDQSRYPLSALGWERVDSILSGFALTAAVSERLRERDRLREDERRTREANEAADRKAQIEQAERAAEAQLRREREAQERLRLEQEQQDKARVEREQQEKARCEALERARQEEQARLLRLYETVKINPGTITLTAAEVELRSIAALTSTGASVNRHLRLKILRAQCQSQQKTASAEKASNSGAVGVGVTIGGIIGLIGGPLGMAFGAAVGAAIGGASADETSSQQKWNTILQRITDMEQK